jgi:putative phosphoribosyl transferase
VRDPDVVVRCGEVLLGGVLAIPDDASGIVVFANGGARGRFGAGDRSLAEALHAAGLGTLLFDLLDPAEAADRSAVFDIQLLGERLRGATDWLERRLGDQLPVGYLATGTGSAAALWAAAEPDADLAAVVCRSGRPDLAGPRLAMVTAPTLLIVGEGDLLLRHSARALARLDRCEHRLIVVPGADHLLREPGTLQVAVRATCDWFVRHLATVPGSAA